MFSKMFTTGTIKQQPCVALLITNIGNQISAFFKPLRAQPVLAFRTPDVWASDSLILPLLSFYKEMDIIQTNINIIEHFLIGVQQSQ